MFEKDGIISFNHSLHSPHSIIYSLIEKEKEILDVGCNYGSLGKELLKKKVITDGVDINKKALFEAKKYYRRVFLRDLYNPSLDIGNNKYDYLVFSDLLEHIPRPDKLILDAKKYLKKSGLLIASIPNVARLEIRLKLLFGKFDYSPGILSQDHLRFFTRESAKKMFVDSGYRVEKIIPTGFGHMTKIFPTLTAFQNVFVCRKIK